jgi:hypothetical protein
VKPRQWAACHLIENFERSPVTQPRLDHHREVRAVAIDGGAQVPSATATTSGVTAKDAAAREGAR